MKAGVLIFVLAFAVSSSENQRKLFFQTLAKDCVVPLINQWNDITKCSVALPFATCAANVSAEFDTEFTPLLKKVENLLHNVCYPDEAEIQALNNAAECVANKSNTLAPCTKDLPEDACNASTSLLDCTKSKLQDCGPIVGSILDEFMVLVNLVYGSCTNPAQIDYLKNRQCLMNNAKDILSCNITGEFNTVGDVCSSVENFRQCIISKSKKACGENASDLVRNSTEDLAFSLELCKDINAINGILVPECQKAFLKCNMEVYMVDPKCTDIPKHLDCLAAATKKCDEGMDPLVPILLINYKNKFPVYCNKDSAFNKNIKSHAECISTNSYEISSKCYAQLQKAIRERKPDDAVGMQRAYVNFLSCIRNDYGEKCTKEAGDAVNELFQPLGDTLDESCRMLTGKRCNSACGLKVATWMFIAALVYLLTRKYE